MAARHSEEHFRRQLDRALAVTRKVLDTARHPCHPADVPHQYDDKYLLAEISTRAAVAAVLNVLRFADPEWGSHAQRIAAWAETRTVSLSLSSRTRCSFLRTVKREVESATQRVSTGFFGKAVSKSVTTVIEHFWQLEIDWKVVVYAGSDPQGPDSLTLIGGSGQHEIKTTGTVGKDPIPPKPEVSVPRALEVDASWLFQHSADGEHPRFDIMRQDAGCRTPRRNKDVEGAVAFFQRFRSWAGQVQSWLSGELHAEQQGHTYDLGCVEADGVFTPVLAVFAFERGREGAPLQLAGDVETFLSEQKRTLEAKRAELCRLLPPAAKGELISAESASFASALAHAAALALQHDMSVDAIEGMLRSQLIAAVGKELHPSDFAEYMDFHHRRLFRPEFRPRGFCYPVRRPEHYPEGSVSVEIAKDALSGDSVPIQTFTVSRLAQEPMRFPLSAAADLAFYGERHLHVCVLHRFGTDQHGLLRLCARARQFSSFILLAGKLAGADLFDPQAAMIVQNKDDLVVPLVLDTIPTKKEFRDAIESLSPEQQRFAKAFREMQLASTVFGVVIIQIKPQLERLLNLPPDSLTKEVALTQELMELFIEYQLPSDLMTYDGDEDAPVAGKVATVKESCAAIRGMICAAKENELKEQAELEQKRLMERDVIQRRKDSYSLDEEGEYEEECCFDECREMMVCDAMPECVNECAMEMECEDVGFADADAAPTAPPPPPPEDHGRARSNAAKVRQPKPQQQAEVGGGGTVSAAVDYTGIPRMLDRRFDESGDGAAVRPTIIKLGEVWTKRSQSGVISDVKEEQLCELQQRKERDSAFDLLDALSRSGALPVDCASLHVLLASTHCFEQSLMDSVIQGNINPIEQAERSSLIMTSTAHNLPVAQLVEPQQLARLEPHCGALLT
eukprot:TRINITY_DN990_c0_g2_i1.p1 TRINITY_DN990_c0_g2~~TRINITY_DN990_c0_g2_i1.p1  ORF type:complete len:933 (+),score=299.99 TRINITY_DN990_c0_g2_i1:85-2799(+)